MNARRVQPLADLQIGQLLANSLVERHDVMHDTRFTHQPRQFGGQFLNAACLAGVGDQVAGFLGVGLEVVQLGQVPIRWLDDSSYRAISFSGVRK